MSESNSDARETARLKYIRSGGKKTLRQIADEVGEKLDTVKSWKRRDKWDEVGGIEKGAGKKKGAVAAGASEGAEHEDASNGVQGSRKRGGQKGNKNAYGNKPHTPQGNKRGLRSGEYERIMYGTLTDDEKRLMALAPVDRDELLIDNIKLLTVREKRMLERIELMRQSAKNGMVASSLTLTKSDAQGNTTNGYSENEFIMLTKLEEALTRVQQRKQVAIDMLHKYMVEDARYLHGDMEDDGDGGIEVVIDGLSDD